MRALLWLIGLFALAAGLAVAGRYNEGYALLVWPPYRIQISLNLLILLLVGGFAAAYALSRLVSRTLALPRAVQQFRQRKGRERASQALYDAARLRIEGRYGQSLKQAAVAYEANESPGLAALLAARAAHSRSMRTCRRGGFRRRSMWHHRRTARVTRCSSASPGPARPSCAASRSTSSCRRIAPACRRARRA